MKSLRLLATLLTLAILGAVVQHLPTTAKPGHVPESIRKSLDEAGLSAVKVIEDNRGALVMTGQVLTQDDRYLAQSVVKSAATGSHAVFDEILVLLPDREITNPKSKD